MNEPTFSGTLSINGIDLFYEEYKNTPEKEAIVLLHGFLSSTFSFRRLIPFLVENYNVIAVDLPPFGKSGKVTTYRYTYYNIGKTIIDLLLSLGYQEVYAAGHSMGGQIALNMMALRSDIVKKGILLGSSGYLPRANQTLILGSYLPFFHHFLRTRLERSGVQKNVENVLFDHSLIDLELLTGYEKPFLDQSIYKGLTKWIRDREGDLAGSALQNIDTPCLLIWGEHDKVVPLEIGKRLSKDLPNSELIVLKNTGHLVQEEKPVEVWEAIQTFIETQKTD
jgi:pimeloyl-ACP methyl ester carboxylesterase